ncbi:MAG: molybdopterin-binding protein [Thermodesulfobacteriota bacterium]|nr:molybdopterin-binding protein [Thermodesulfobacteriota bacterium]
MSVKGKSVELELFEKTEIWIKPIKITKVNLDLIAEKVAEVLRLKKSEVMVVDVREDLVTLDIMKKAVHAEDIIGKKEALLKALATVPGVSITPETTLHSEGILGLVDIEDQKVAQNLLKKMRRMRRQISDRIQKRAIVFPSGFEIEKWLIQDTNSPYIKKKLTQEGFTVTIGEILKDNLEHIVSALSRAIDDGFGLIITTGGVGAEDKDRMVEALLKLDPEASTPYIIRYEKGTGRHEKDGVKIGVAYLKPSFIIALPGPHEEAKIGAEVIIEGLKKGWDKKTLALFLSQKYIEVLKKIHHSS